MSPLDRSQRSEMINVHMVNGDKNAILFLKNAGHDFVEGLFYKAKRFGRAEFYLLDVQYEIIKNKDFTFTIQQTPEQGLTTEQFS